MDIQQIRNATLKIRYGGSVFLIDPWLQDQETGFSARARRLEMQGVKCPMDTLPETPETILKDVDCCPNCQAEMGKSKYDPSWVDEAEGLSAILDDDW